MAANDPDVEGIADGGILVGAALRSFKKLFTGKTSAGRLRCCRFIKSK